MVMEPEFVAPSRRRVERDELAAFVEHYFKLRDELVRDVRVGSKP